MRAELVFIIVLCVRIALCRTPDCQDYRIVFISEPSNIEVALTANTVAQFSCQYKGGRENETKLEWIINSKRYQSTNLPANHIVLENGNMLYVTNITSKDNNSLYQCQVFLGDNEQQNQCAYRSNIGKLVIGLANNFIQISFDEATSSINCTFINQPRKSEKYCLVKYSTAIPMCQLYSQVKGHVSNSNSIFLHLDLEDTTIICYNVEAGNYSKTVRIGGSLTLEPSYEKNNMLAHVYIAALVPVVITVLGTTTTLFYLVRYKPKKSLNLLEEYTLDRPNEGHLPQQYDELSLPGSYYELPKGRQMAHMLLPLEIPIDRAISFYTIHIVTDDNCLMYKFTTEHYPDYQPQDGFGYYKLTNQEIRSISPHKRVILMEENNPSLPKLITTGSNLKKLTACRGNTWHVYAQDRSFTKMLNSGSKILCYFPSEVVIAYTKMYDVTEPCNSKHLIPYHKPEWTRYCYFEHTKLEYIKPDQRIIAMKQDGTLVTGPGIRHLLGITGDGSTLIPSDNYEACSNFKHVFIQSRESGQILEPCTKYLFCAMMDEIRNYYVIYDVDKDCNMTSFGGCNIPGFKIKGGYGYYEFKEPEYIKPHRNVMLVDKKGRLFSGAGARFFYTGCEYDMDAVLRKKRVPPPSLDGTEWAHIFVQSHSTKRILKKGTKFLYCEHNIIMTSIKF